MPDDSVVVKFASTLVLFGDKHKQKYDNCPCNQSVLTTQQLIYPNSRAKVNRANKTSHMTTERHTKPTTTAK